MSEPKPVFLCPGCFKPVCRHCGGCECPEMPHIATTVSPDHGNTANTPVGGREEER